MSILNVRLPKSLHDKLEKYAQREGTSVNQIINSAVAEKLAALSADDYFAARAKRASRKKFEAVLASVPDVEPEPFDRLPPKKRRRA